METRHFANIQALRGIAVLLVLGRHMQICIERMLGKSQLLGAFLLGDFGVDLFFVISGFVMVISTESRFRTWREAGVFLYHRVSRIYPLYWLYSLPTIWVFFCRPQWLHRYDKNDPISVGKSLLLWPQQGLPILGQGWSLTFEMFYYLAFVALMFLPRRYFLKGLLFWALAVAGLNAWFTYKTGGIRMRPEGWVVCNIQSVEFIAGALVGVAVQQQWLAWVRPAAAWSCFGGAVAWVGLVLLPLGFELLNGDRVLGYGLPALALVYGAAVLELNRVRLPAMLARMGQYSYSIYLSHILVLGAVVQFWPWRGMSGVLAELGLSLLMLVCAVGAGAVSYHGFERPLLTWSRRWLPPRRKGVASSSPVFGVPSALALEGEISVAP